MSYCSEPTTTQPPLITPESNVACLSTAHGIGRSSNNGLVTRVQGLGSRVEVQGSAPGGEGLNPCRKVSGLSWKEGQHTPLADGDLNLNLLAIARPGRSTARFRTGPV
eukprot:515942-Rhodomonas_salina.2